MGVECTDGENSKGGATLTMRITICTLAALLAFCAFSGRPHAQDYVKGAALTTDSLMPRTSSGPVACPTHRLLNDRHYQSAITDSKGHTYIYCAQDALDGGIVLLRLSGVRLTLQGGGK